MMGMAAAVRPASRRKERREGGQHGSKEEDDMAISCGMNLGGTYPFSIYRIFTVRRTNSLICLVDSAIGEILKHFPPQGLNGRARSFERTLGI
jgi:hypothetical protein